MKTETIKAKIKEGYYLNVCLEPTKKYDKVTLKTYLQKEGINIVHPVYYNHCKDLLNVSQLRLIELFNEIKNWQFRDKMEFNIEYKKDPTSKELNEKYFVLQSIQKIKYLEQH